MLIPLCLEMAKWWWCFDHIGDDEDVTENIIDENITDENFTDENVDDIDDVTDENVDDNDCWPGKRGISAPGF